MKKNDLALVCCYFNPIHYKSKLHNFKLFYNNLKQFNVELLIVELAIGNEPFELSKFPNVIKVRSDSIMWHKERLLNIGAKKLLKKGYKKIVWLDTDITFENDDWIEKTSQKLDECMACQLFGTMPSGTIIENSVAKRFIDHNNSGDFTYTGYAWGARAEFFETVKLFDYSIIGGGDILNYFGFSGRTRINTRKTWFKTRYTGAVVDSYKRWFIECNTVMKGKIGFVDNNMKVFSHGTFKNRQYNNRHRIILRHNFNPYTDLKTNKDGCFEWASDKPKMHQKIIEYFKDRKEDQFFTKAN